ncbi:16S rRNA (cytosine(1402)-N(4))-methyltransferase RsmH [Corynebacterium accolens]|uniref:16S rRNA (cytosine(1402)-N(4))-methyltransferase RsmH n=1 Tax=Corynebacterium accolens TaxID=38284 RepID=UPI0025506333|nr:16S rRNA (cytosine(1402)-N(4))-methyltransferase RsmH [Corynebacterium accolens]MDK8468658.1 16S rRNA (cytosine(1402)-N(4))-methyltransferase RsmH [Corynebacterium accolens]MDK8497455.1 16S rRNA (cytosine(1402)-N(4))-methyltransferase RsmH [Corynebacterium accolens]MDK8592052.1 16S rRNA (cytosine(1402)-N(4))-methyltransferase RsmH [Corynebacterium accolens]MDK8674253.1 16S rRNA (cytosine(1402)-N(4))-methyltransferase RsmH [Corynebacterium accolens]
MATTNLNYDVADNHGHVPVMRERMAELLRPGVEAAGSQAVLVDATLGAGGHSEYFLQTFPQARVIGVDRDEQALQNASVRLEPFGPRFCAVNARFDELGTAIAQGEGDIFDAARAHGIAGALFDLGVSSMQLDQAERGFAYKTDAPLDMRMDPSHGLTAADVLNTYSHGDLARILKTYGDERFAGKIASAVLKEREKEPFSTSGRLVELLYSTIPAATRRTGGHPAKRTFQALRVEVNRELEAIENVLPVITSALSIGARAVFMSYQSLEDRLVKAAFKELSTSTTPAGLPMDLPGTAPEFATVTRGAEKASAAEVEENSRAGSVRVRALERLEGTPEFLPPGGKK